MQSIKRMGALAVMAAMSSVAVFAADMSSKPLKVDGWVSDSMCGAKHMGTGAACVKKCIGEGAKPVFVDDANKTVWTIDNPDVVKAHYGHHVALTATEDSAAKTLHVDKVTMLADQGAKGASGADSTGGAEHQ